MTDDYYKSVVNEMVVNACEVPVYEVVVKLQHTELGVLIDKEAYVEGQVVGQACIAGRHFVGVVGDDVQLSKALVIDTRRRADLSAVRDIPVSIDVGHPYAEFPSNFMVSAMIALSGSASPARRAVDTDSPNCRKHASRWYSTIWYT